MLWPISAAISSTDRSPWARRSTISARRPLAKALATSAKASNNASLAARSPMALIVGPGSTLVKYSNDLLTKMALGKHHPRRHQRFLADGGAARRLGSR